MFDTPLKPTRKPLKNRRTSSNNFIDMWADFMIKESEKSADEDVMTNRRIVQISKEEGGEKDESGNDSVLNISLHDDDVDSTTDRQYQLQ